MNPMPFTEWLRQRQQDDTLVAAFNVTYGTSLRYTPPRRRSLLSRLLDAIVGPALPPRNKPAEEIAFLAHCADLHAQRFPQSCADYVICLNE